MPELLGEDLDVFVNGSALIREEIDFTRKEFGAGAGVSRHFREISADVAARYNYQVLTATRPDFDPAYGLREAEVGSFVLDLRHNQEDNPLAPRKGYKVFSNLEIASEALLGNANFQRMESSFAYHRPVGNLQWIHFGFSHGFITTPGSPATELPFNRRFFPGGDNSIRGYQLGGAAPRDASGHLIGAETYMLGNFEFEQGLTKTWSVVGFVDALGQAARIEEYPFRETLLSVGIGLRWKTIIGPVRFEYGHNLTPREEDPGGTLHLAIGFPF
jgi:outer membrane translocation and assembly module TamA